MNEIFFELIRIALGNANTLSRRPTQEEWELLYETAKKQCLIGICFSGIQRLVVNAKSDYASLGLSQSLYFTWMGITAQIQQRNEIVNKQCAELQKKLSSDGQQSCILKGQGVASLYTVTGTAASQNLPLLRQSGDIDVWMNEKRDDVITYIRRCCLNLNVDICEKHIEFPFFNDTIVEAHFTPVGMKTPIIGRRAKVFYGEQRRDQMQHKVILCTGEEIVAPDKNFQAIHILHHAFGHFLFEGIGMRQVMDYYFVMRQPFSNKEKTDITRTLKQLELWNFACGISYILKEVFGGGDTFIPTNERLGKRILKGVMEEGNFGKYDQKRDDAKMHSSWYRFWYHNIRMWKYIGMAPWTIVMGPFVRINEYIWRLGHGYFKQKRV